MAETLQAGIPASLGPCRIIRELGAGAMGRVYLAELTTDRPYAAAGALVAVKVLHPALLADEESVHRFEREAMLGTTVRHARVVSTWESGAAQLDGIDAHYLILEYVEGRSLRSLMTELDRAPEVLLRHIGAQAARGLQAVHAVGAVHRDVKPENILITPDDQVKLMDLGVAHVAAAARLTRTGMALGTFAYAAPEQLDGARLDARTDLYSLGVVLYEAATGVQPFTAPTLVAIMRRHFDYVPPRLREVNPRISQFFDAVVAALLAKDPAGRFDSAAALADTLQQGEDSAWWREQSSDWTSHPAGAGLGRLLAATHWTPFVGRDDAISRLRTAFAAAQAGEGRIVWIEGEAGIGRTRLVLEFAAEIESRNTDSAVLYGSCIDSGTSVGYDGLRHAVVRSFGRAGLQQRLESVLAGSAAVVTEFATLLLDGTSASAARALSEDTVAGLFYEVFRSLRANRPVVWIIDDIHEASSEARSVIKSVAQRVADLGILLVLTSRPDASGATAELIVRASGVSKIMMGGLDEESVRLVVASRIDRPALAEDLGHQLASRSDGNPLLLVLMLLDLAQAGAANGAVTGSSGAFASAASSLTSLQDLIGLRLHALSEQERLLLDVASVQGLVFDPDAIAQTLGLSRLAVLQSLAIIERRTGFTRSTATSFRFAQRELARLLYDSLPGMLKQEYHSLLADAIRRRLDGSGAAPEALTGVDAFRLAEHFFKGNRPAEGRTYIVEALRFLNSSYGGDATLETLGALALESLTSGDRALRCEIQLARAEALRRLGRAAEEKEAAQDALRAAGELGDPGWRSRAELALATHHMGGGAYEDAARLIDLAAADATAANARSTEAEALGALARLHLLGGQPHEARVAVERQIAIAREVGDRRMECRALMVSSGMLIGISRPVEAATLFERQLALANEIGYREGETTALYGLGMMCLWRGDHGDARGLFERQLSLTQGIAHGSALAHTGLAQVAIETAKLDDAERHVATMLDRAESARLPHLAAYSVYYRGELWRARGNVPEAKRQLQLALELSRSIKASMVIAEVLLALGRLEFERGGYDAAAPLLRESSDLVARYDLSMPGPLPAAYLAVMGGGDPPPFDDDERVRCSIAAELHLVLARLEHAPLHLERSTALLTRMSRHLDEASRADFWTTYPVARLCRSLTAPDD